MNIIDPNNPIPKYLQIAAWLREMIQTGRYQPGEKLPSETKLAHLCQVNRNTLRQAVSELTAIGLLRKEKGRGTFVNLPSPLSLTHRLQRISSFGDDLREMGIQDNTRLLSKGVEIASQQIADTLMLGADQRVAAVKRLRIGDHTPLIYEESYLPAQPFKGILEMRLTGSMYQLITDRFGVELVRSEQTIGAVNLNRAIAGYFHLPENSAGLFMESVTYNEGNVPIEVLWSYYRADKYLFKIEVGRYLIQNAVSQNLLDK